MHNCLRNEDCFPKNLLPDDEQSLKKHYLIDFYVLYLIG